MNAAAEHPGNCQTMNLTITNEPGVIPGRMRIPIQFAEALPIELKIMKTMKNSTENKPVTHSLFHLAASLDDRVISPRVKRSAGALPLEDWIFSRERIENALRARVTEIKKRSLTAPASTRGPQPTRKTAGRPVRYHPFEIANAVANAA